MVRIYMPEFKFNSFYIYGKIYILFILFQMIIRGICQEVNLSEYRKIFTYILYLIETLPVMQN